MEAMLFANAFTPAVPMTVSAEVDLLRRARHGHHDACEELFVKYLKESHTIRGLLRRALSQPEDREEMLHEIYLQLVGSHHDFRGESRLSTYVYQVARITIFQKYRRESTLKRKGVYRVISEGFDIEDNVNSNPEYCYVQKESRNTLEKLIGTLPDAYREALRLRVIENYSYDEIAHEMKLPLNTVSTKIHKGKKLLTTLARA
jgi:RNA polymerase sigma-70 factor, ECF subfamily